jgi:hypothetical protein
MKPAPIRNVLLGGAIAASLAACGGGGSSLSSGTSGTGSTQQMGDVPLLISDASSDDWALIGIQILSIALVPQDGSSNVVVYTSPAGGTFLNLEDLDDLGELLGNVSVPVGTYVGAVITVGGNPGDVLLTTSSDPQTGFGAAANTAIASNAIQIQHTQGTAGSLTEPIEVNFKSPLVVSSTATPNSALDLEFDLSHPAFIIQHTPPAAAGATIWAVNFEGPVRHHPIADITRLVLRHMYGTLDSVASDGSSMTITRDFATLPVVSSETAVQSSQMLTVLCDTTNGTIVYDVDGKTSSTVMSFSGVAALTNGKYLRVAARFQQNGTLVATRVYASSSFNSIWLSPEGHVVHVDAANGILTVDNESGHPVPVTVDSGTEFDFRDTMIGSGTGFLTGSNLVRGFKVHITVDDPLQTPLHAQTVDIETADYSGAISQANSTGFAYTHDYFRASDDYQVALDFISSSTPNGSDGSGNPVDGFKYWDFAFPTLVTDSNNVPNVATAFMDATSSSVTAYGLSGAVWGDTANLTGWSVPWTVLLPSPLPLATVTSGLVTNGNASTFTATELGTTSPLTVNVNSASGSAALVYQVDRSGGVVSVSSIDISTPGGLATFSAALTAGTPIKMYGVPQSNGTLNGYVLVYFTGSTMPSS